MSRRRNPNDLIRIEDAQPDVPDTNVGDMISRQAALDVLHEYFDGMLETDTVCPKDLYNEIEALPSAQPEHLCTVMERIKEKYAKAMNTPCIHNPMAWALYQVWKEYDK